ncbi:MAG: HAMP domain-containing sensor histidine kinase [Marmoricola sp.]
MRNRLVLGATAVGLSFAVLFGVLATWRVHHAQDQAVRAALQSRVELARDEVTPDGAINQDAGSPKTDLVQVIGPDGRPLASSTALAGVRRLVDVGTVRASPGGVETRLSLQRPDIDLAVLAVPLRLAARGDSPGGTGALVVAVDAEGFNTATSDLLGLLIAGLVAVVLAIAALSWLLTGRALVSVTRITESAEAVRPEDLASGLPVPRHDAELARLVEALNRMLVRLHESHATELAFAADAGHRLRTPVATLRAEAELALRETDPAELTAALERVVHDADQLTSIVDRMLARSRARDRAPEPTLHVLAAASTRWHRQARLAEVTLILRIDEDLTPETSCAQLVEVVEPILDNAVRHTRPGGDVDIDVRLDGELRDSLVVLVSNTGDTISTDLAPLIFGAWVSSRDASVAGGLGLWLARETARDLGGEVDLVEEGVHTTTFRVRLPTTNRA